MRRGTVTGKEIDSGKKRVNLTLSLSEYDDLHLTAEHQNITLTTLACSWVVQRAREEAGKIRKSGYVPKAQRGEDLFSKPKGKRK